MTPKSMNLPAKEAGLSFYKIIIVDDVSW